MRKILEEYYGEIVGTSKMLDLIKSDKVLKYVGQGCYTLNEAVISLQTEAKYSKPITQRIDIEVPKTEQLSSIPIIPER